jgi:hypothetical protein
MASPASAATTRAEYVAQVDPICQAGLAQEEAASRPVAKKLKRLHKQARKARFYDFVVIVEQGVNAQIATIPPPIEDSSLIQVWLRARGEEVIVIQRMFRALAKGDFFAAFDLLLEIEAKSTAASDLVRDFGFQHCSSLAKQLGF